MNDPLSLPHGISTYTEDGRLPIEELYQRYRLLGAQHGWLVDVVHHQREQLVDGSTITIPIICLKTQHTGRALWVLSGIHGEEPAGPNAIARHIHIFEELGLTGVPIVLIPLCNPSGYHRNWRYPNEPRDFHRGASVGDSEHVLPSRDDPTKARRQQPACVEAAALVECALQTSKHYPPQLVMDHHEDEALEASYIYAHDRSPDQGVAREVVQILHRSGIPLQSTGTTRFGEVVRNAVVEVDQNGLVIQDGSIDELLRSKTIVVNGVIEAGPSARTVITVETPTKSVPLEKRVKAHANILRSLPELWKMTRAHE